MNERAKYKLIGFIMMFVSSSLMGGIGAFTRFIDAPGDFVSFWRNFAGLIALTIIFLFIGGFKKVKATRFSGMMLLSDGKYGYRGYGNALQVSLLRGSSRPDPYPELGKRRFRLGLRWEKAEPLALKKAGEAFVHSNLPYASNTAHPGVLPLTRRFLTLEGNAVVSAVKVPESGKGLLVRLAAVSREEEAAVHLAAPGFQKAMLVDFSEQVLENRPMKQGVVSLILAPGETVGILFV